MGIENINWEYLAILLAAGVVVQLIWQLLHIKKDLGGRITQVKNPVRTVFLVLHGAGLLLFAALCIRYAVQFFSGNELAVIYEIHEGRMAILTGAAAIINLVLVIKHWTDDMIREKGLCAGFNLYKWEELDGYTVNGNQITINSTRKTFSGVQKQIKWTLSDEETKKVRSILSKNIKKRKK
ncbi:MAG: hypothetical protein FH749_15125 [Firmicutes bacterium]|nr:hypothetical protein [Bacillota bacterium]